MEAIEIEIEEILGTSGTSDYNALENLPTLDGEKIIGEIKEKDPTVPSWAKQENKPGYDAKEVGAVPMDYFADNDDIEDIMSGEAPIDGEKYINASGAYQIVDGLKTEIQEAKEIAGEAEKAAEEVKEKVSEVLENVVEQIQSDIAEAKEIAEKSSLAAETADKKVEKVIEEIEPIKESVEKNSDSITGIGEEIGNMQNILDGRVPYWYDTLITGKETLTNKWRDGKPVYQMLVDFGLITQGVTIGVNVQKNIDVSIENLDIAWIETAYMTTYDKTGFYQLGFIRTNAFVANNTMPGIWIHLTGKTSTGINVRMHNSVGDAYNMNNAHFVIQYTKTMDITMPSYQMPVPYFDLTTVDVEYRTNEVWNGKPVYKKQLKMPFGSNLGQSSIPHLIDNVDNPVRIEFTTVNADGTNAQTYCVQFDSGRLIQTGSIESSFNRTHLYYWVGTNRSGVIGYFTLFYTKTIDTPSIPGLIPAIVQGTGNSTAVTMSQKAITDLIKGGALGSVSENDYEKLENLPTLDGREIIGEIKELDPTVPEWAKNETKPTYEASEVGAVSVNNRITADYVNSYFDFLLGR